MIVFQNLVFRILDISFNRVKEIEGLDNLHNLKKLFLSSNKITTIKNVNHLTNLTLLELGDNKIKVIIFYPQFDIKRLLIDASHYFTRTVMGRFEGILIRLGLGHENGLGVLEAFGPHLFLPKADCSLVYFLVQRMLLSL